MVLKLLLGIILVTPLDAQTQHKKCNHNGDGVINCIKSNDHDSKKDLASKYLEWWAASNVQVKAAFCNNPGIPSNQAMTKFINRNPSSTKVSAEFSGIKLEGEDPHMVDLLKKLTKYEPNFNFQKEDADGQKTFTIPETCKKVLCAAESIFGKDRALKMIYALDKYEINMSSKTDENLAAWKSSEIDIVLEAVDDLPGHLAPFNKNQYFKHFKRGYGPSDSVVANASITVFSVWEDNLDNDEERMSALVHEIGHNIGRRLDQDESPEWLDISGWEQKEDVWESTLKDQVVSKYGLTNPAEDFAETFVAFRYNPELLKKMSPKKYDYMKDNIFLGLEYDSAQKCKDTNSTLNKLIQAINIKEAPLPDNFGICEEEIEKIFLKEDVDLKVCINRVKFKNELEKKLIGKSDVEKNTIRNAMKFKEVNGLGVTKEDEKIAYQKIIGDIYGSVASRYNNYSGADCTSPKESGWQNFLLFNEHAFQKKHQGITEKKALNKIMAKICNDTKGQRTLNCNELKPYMQNHMPRRFNPTLREIQLKELEEISKSQDNTRVDLKFMDHLKNEEQSKVETPNYFRCSF